MGLNLFLCGELFAEGVDTFGHAVVGLDVPEPAGEVNMVAFFDVEVGGVGASEGAPDGDVGDGKRVSDEVGPQDEVVVKLLESSTSLFEVTRREAC